MLNRRWTRIVALVALLSTPLVVLGCGDDAVAGEPRFFLELQATTATVTATWTYTTDVALFEMEDEWTSVRQSGGDAWSLTGTTRNQTATFEVPRSVTSDATGEFCVTPVRLSPDPKQFDEVCGTFAVPMQVPPDVQIDSLTINVTDASGVHRPVDWIDVLVDTGAGDTTWRYSPHLADGSVLEDHVVQTGAAHDGLQLTALAFAGDDVVACSGDCRLYPQLIQFEYRDWPLYRPVHQAAVPGLRVISRLEQ